MVETQGHVVDGSLSAGLGWGIVEGRMDQGMSGVYIKGIDIPKSCWACTFFDSDGFCVIDGLSRDAEEKTNCPLIPVPDHGRLVDADEFYKDINESILLTDGFKVTFNLWFDAQPTIIPADKEEEHG